MDAASSSRADRKMLERAMEGWAEWVAERHGIVVAEYYAKKTLQRQASGVIRSWHAEAHRSKLFRHIAARIRRSQTRQWFERWASATFVSEAEAEELEGLRAELTLKFVMLRWTQKSLNKAMSTWRAWTAECHAIKGARRKAFQAVLKMERAGVASSFAAWKAHARDLARARAAAARVIGRF